MLETQFPRQYQESRIFKDENGWKIFKNGIFSEDSEDSATAQSRSSLLLAPICKAEIPDRVRCHLSGVVRSSVFPGFSRFSLKGKKKVIKWVRWWVQQLDLWALGVSSCVWFLLVQSWSAREKIICLAHVVFLSFSVFLSLSLSLCLVLSFQIDDFSWKGISSKSGWLGLIETFGADCIAGISTGNCLCRPPLWLLCFTVPSSDGETCEVMCHASTWFDIV